MGVKIGPKVHSNWNRQYGGIMRKATKVDPRTITMFTSDDLRTRLSGGRKKDHRKIVLELEKRGQPLVKPEETTDDVLPNTSE